MNACSDFIQFDRSDDWQQVINKDFYATQIGDNSYVPIGEKDLGVVLSESYVVIVVLPVDAPETWIYGVPLLR